jgi:tetratricopeptide (TPR) repeat protein
MEQSNVDGGAASFGPTLKRLREGRGLSLRALAAAISYSASWLSRIENGLVAPSMALAGACDEALEAGGRLVDLAVQEQEQEGDEPRAWVPRPAQLPAGAGPNFVGRTGELAQLDRFLESADRAQSVMTVVIDGLPGVGKTALAIRWAHQVSHRFPEGVLFTDLRGFASQGQRADPWEVLAYFLTALGVPGQAIPSGIEQRAAMMRSLVDGQRILVVLDNASDAAQVEPLLLGAAGCAVVVTSRRRLAELAVHEGASRVALGPMLPEDSVALLTGAIGERAGADAEAVSVLARRCAHLPLALRIAAERVVAHPHLRVAELAADLTGEAQRLDVLAADQLAVRTAFSWSYRELSWEDAEAARAFRLLGLSPDNRITIDVAAALADRSRNVAGDLLERLERVHLVEQTARDSWSMHELLRVYAARQAVEEDSAHYRSAAVRRLVERYVHLADAAHRALAPHWYLPPPASPAPSDRMVFRDPVQARGWFDREAETVTAVTLLAADHRLPGAWELPLRLWAWALRRRPWSLWKMTCEIGLRAARDLGERAAEAWIAGHLACVHGRLGETRYAQELFDRAAALHQEVNDRRGLAWTLAGRGLVAAQRGEAKAARAHFRQALDLFAEAEDDLGQAAVQVSLGESLTRQGRYEEATRHLDQALADFEDMGERYGQGLALMEWARLAHRQGDQEHATVLLDQALVARRDAGDLWGEAEVLERRGHLALIHGRPGDARDAWQEALTRYEQLDDPRAEELRKHLRAFPDMP